MISTPVYVYKLWNGKEVVGILSLNFKIQGLHVTLPFAPSVLKQIYGRKYGHITCPILLRSTDNGVMIRTERLIVCNTCRNTLGGY